jgi:hypothetical protein
MPKLKILTGLRFGKITVGTHAGIKGRHHIWNCTCDCGGTSIATSCNLQKGNTTSCGCVQKKRASISATRHGKSKSKIYNVWRGMHTRCYDKAAIMYNRYGARGIKVCERWNSFENFLKDMGEPQGERKALNRINNDGNYEPSNCEWTTQKENNRNTVRTIYVDEWQGKRRKLIELSEEYNINYRCLYKRIRSGWSIERALCTRSGRKSL